MISKTETDKEKNEKFIDDISAILNKNRVVYDPFSMITNYDMYKEKVI